MSSTNLEPFKKATKVAHDATHYRLPLESDVPLAAEPVEVTPPSSQQHQITHLESVPDSAPKRVHTHGHVTQLPKNSKADSIRSYQAPALSEDAPPPYTPSHPTVPLSINQPEVRTAQTHPIRPPWISDEPLSESNDAVDLTIHDGSSENDAQYCASPQTKSPEQLLQAPYRSQTMANAWIEDAHELTDASLRRPSVSSWPPTFHSRIHLWRDEIGPYLGPSGLTDLHHPHRPACCASRNLDLQLREQLDIPSHHDNTNWSIVGEADLHEIEGEWEHWDF